MSKNPEEQSRVGGRSVWKNHLGQTGESPTYNAKVPTKAPTEGLLSRAHLDQVDLLVPKAHFFS